MQYPYSLRSAAGRLSRQKTLTALLLLLLLAVLTVPPLLLINTRGSGEGEAGAAPHTEKQCQRACPTCIRQETPLHAGGGGGVPLSPLHSHFGTTARERQCDESHSFTLIRRLRENNTTYCASESATTIERPGHMHCLEAEGCVLCRGRNLVVDFSQIRPRDGAYSAQGTHKHFDYERGAFGMAGCKLDSSLVNGRGFATLLSNVWKTWTHYGKPQECDVVVEHPVFIITRFEAWNLWHQMGDWYCAFLASVALGIDPRQADSQVLFFDSHEPSALVHPYSLFSPRREVQRTLHESNWRGKRVCFRDAILPFEGYAPAYMRNGYHVTVGDPCGPSDLLMSFARWVLDQYNVLQEPVFDEGPAITMIVRGAGTGEKKHTDRHLSNQDTLVTAVKKHIAETYSQHGEVKFQVVDFATLTFKEQLQLVHSKTNILVGVHGAGLSHLVFLPPEAVVGVTLLLLIYEGFNLLLLLLRQGMNVSRDMIVITTPIRQVIELVPESFKSLIFFRNMAKQTGKAYLTVPMHDSSVDEERFFSALDAAVALTRSFGTNIAPFD